MNKNSLMRKILISPIIRSCIESLLTIFVSIFLYIQFMRIGTGTTLLIILACLIIGDIISIIYSFWINNKLKRGLFSEKAVNELFEKK